MRREVLVVCCFFTLLFFGTPKITQAGKERVAICVCRGQGHQQQNMTPSFYARYSGILSDFYVKLITLGGKVELCEVDLKCLARFSDGKESMVKLTENTAARRDKAWDDDGMQRSARVWDSVSMQKWIEWNKSINFHLGAIYRGLCEIGDRERVVNRHTKQHALLWKPVVFDIDLNDCAHLRAAVCGCGAQKKLCAVCWKFLVIATRVMQKVFQAFRFQRYYFVFSGGRGLHVWVYDARVLSWSREKRKQFLTLISRGMVQGSHPLLTLLMEKVMMPFFVNELLPTFQKRHPQHTQVAQMATIPCKMYQELCGWNQLDKDTRVRVVQEYCWPIFDQGVTCDPSHLTRLPMMPHHSSGNIAYPIQNIEHHTTVIELWNAGKLHHTRVTPQVISNGISYIESRIYQ